jgi:alanine or glycine:cation symporter, AGCS family
MYIINLLDSAIQWYNEYIGGYLILFLLIPTGIFFSIKFRFLQLRGFYHAIQIVAGKFDKKEEPGDVSHFKALSTALASTVGTGNIVGVALAIYYGGPGAMFWIWVTGFLGMMLKMVECTLSLKFRKKNSDGTVSGGPMYYMEIGLKYKLGKFAKILAIIFAFATILCSFGTGNMAQSNSMSEVLYSNYNIPLITSGLIIAILVFLIIVGGIQRIADVASKLVPFMAIVYFITTLTIILLYIDQIPSAMYFIVHDAFTGTAATGGFVGSAFIMTMVWGVRRGLFSNEAGQGSAPIAHAAAKTEYPMREGLVSSLEPFIDTLVICTLTALVVILTGAWQLGPEYKGVKMTVKAFELGLDKIGLAFLAKHIIAGGLIMFAFTTVIGWSYYGTRATQYVFGDKAIKPYYYLYTIFVFIGAIWGLDMVWHFVDMVITFMTLPNLIAMILLTPVMKNEVNNYFKTKH